MISVWPGFDWVELGLQRTIHMYGPVCVPACTFRAARRPTRTGRQDTQDKNQNSSILFILLIHVYCKSRGKFPCPAIAQLNGPTVRGTRNMPHEFQCGLLCGDND